jgi:hypothetical protein
VPAAGTGEQQTITTEGSVLGNVLLQDRDEMRRDCHIPGTGLGLRAADDHLAVGAYDRASVPDLAALEIQIAAA